MFDPYGQHVHKISFSSAVCGTSVDSEGFVYVVERGKNKIHKY